MKQAKHNARLKNLTDRIVQLCASNGVSLAYQTERDAPYGGCFVFVPHDKQWDKALRDAADETKEKPKDGQLADAAREGFGDDASEGRVRPLPL